LNETARHKSIGINYTAYAEMLAQEKLRAENLEVRMESLTERLYANYDTILSKSGNEELQAPGSRREFWPG
jgi:hypothetical protein